MERNIDVSSFLQWLQAAHADIEVGAVDPAREPYVADPQTLSGFIAVRFRDEFRPAFSAWIATRPLLNSQAPSTPFQLPEYSLASDAEVDRLMTEAETRAHLALKASERAENYVLLTVLFAIGLVFASMGPKVRSVGTGRLMLALATLSILVAAMAAVTFPVRI